MIKFIKKDHEDGFGFIGLVIVVATIGILVGGGFYFKELQQQKSLWDIGRDAEKKAEEQKAKQGGIDISTWKTYHDELNGFTVRYPNSWYTGAYGKGKSSEVRNFLEYNHGGVRPKGGLVVSLKKGCDANLDSNGFIVQTYGPLRQLEKSFCKNNFQIFFELDEQVTIEDKNLLERIVNTLIIDDTSDWQTYRNEEYGFEFRYPGDLKPRGRATGELFDFTGNSGGIRTKIVVNRFDHYLQELRSEDYYESNSLLNVQEFIYDGHKAAKLSLSALSEYNITGVFLQINDQLILHMDIYCKCDTDVLRDKILSTFKFIPSINSESIK